MKPVNVLVIRFNLSELYEILFYGRVERCMCVWGIGSKQNTGISKANSASSHIWLKTKLRTKLRIIFSHLLHTAPLHFSGKFVCMFLMYCKTWRISWRYITQCGPPRSRSPHAENVFNIIRQTQHAPELLSMELHPLWDSERPWVLDMTWIHIPLTELRGWRTPIQHHYIPSAALNISQPLSLALAYLRINWSGSCHTWFNRDSRCC